MQIQRAIRGFTLIELMIAMVAGLIVSYAVVAFTMASMKSNAEYVQSAKLTQSLRNALDLVVRDLRRAGYDDNAVTRLAGGAESVAVGPSPFSQLLLDNSNPSPASGSCIIYGYDRPGGTAGTVQVDNGEVRGIRRVVNPKGVGVLEYATSATTVRPTCAGATGVYTAYPATCNATSRWCPLTDPATVNITDFDIVDTPTIVGTNPSAIRIRNLQIDITARLVGDDGSSYLNGVSTSYQRGLAATIRVRTDCVKATIADCNASP